MHQDNVSHIGWASLSLANASCSPVERKTGEVFPEEVDGGRRLLGVGVRRANVLGLKSIDVYAFGNCSFLFVKHLFFFFLLLMGSIQCGPELSNSMISSKLINYYCYVINR